MIGERSPDPSFVITGKLSTSIESKLYFDTIRSQKEVEKVRIEMENELANERVLDKSWSKECNRWKKK
ncbi:hypothetical protein HanXRQr2_Chr12g0520981 [Helianthus annuus]|uniref:Uncharacterized protein n=1 Tax=Helianthus annuus TaxID=4232 RepID=A0A251SXX3_HELAN|nr:hypothetical protein HanXRQr2_Chr12g0520981 [Helianthus annuus]KAJ0861042.1 hypothetical protein HanPSC8_Chr12g0502271 [Helianthus annuus]